MCLLTLRLFILGLTAAGTFAVQASPNPQTFCNPLDLDYRFQLTNASRREAADPLVVLYHDEYWLFASKSGGYWHSPDFRNWVYVATTNLPIEDYAPAAAVIGGQLYYTAFNSRAIYRATDPAAGTWTKAADLKPYPDPDLFQDDNGRVYVYYGCSAGGEISMAQLDPANGFREIGSPVTCLKSDPQQRGWEIRGEDNTGAMSRGKMSDVPWVEGAWMTRHAGKYYLQYAAPGAQFRTYADGVFVGDTPAGPFTYAPYSPFSHKPTGFIGGAGHSGTFQDKLGNWWHITTMSISVRHPFERRLGVFPVTFLPDGQMVCDTRLGDYPQWLPGTPGKGFGTNSPGWMLLSYAKKAEASSTRKGFDVSVAFDENIRTWWCAATGNAGEWLKVDLGKTCLVNALQINFADQGAHILGKLHDDAYQYFVEASRDGSHWEKILDRSANHRDSPHDYTQLETPVQARYLRLVNVHCPAGALFSVSGFRIFGLAPGSTAAPVKTVTARLNPADTRKATISWPPSRGAEFYIVRYGLAPDRMFNNYQIYGATEATINALNRNTPYCFTVDAVNDSGVTPATTTARK
jgi:xylan 1,4-beta-xylosidase